MRNLRSSVSPDGHFIYGIHKPSYTVTNHRLATRLAKLGSINGDKPVGNERNYPSSEVQVENADWIFEIPNPLPFKGSTYINKVWADASAANYQRIRLPEPEPLSLSQLLEDTGVSPDFLEQLPEPLLLALATCSTDPTDLIRLAEHSCDIEKDGHGKPTGLGYARSSTGTLRAVIHHHQLFEAVANNPHLPDSYKVVMVLRPGTQGGSEIVGEIAGSGKPHIYEYLRRNSYISGGHYAANMAEDDVRYSINELTLADMTGLRHLYYQRTFTRLGHELQLPGIPDSGLVPVEELEQLRLRLVEQLTTHTATSSGTLWGWNFGFDYAPTKYRLHASHQQVHQQYAMLPDTIETYCQPGNMLAEPLIPYGCGDLVAEVVREYRRCYSRDFFTDYLQAIDNNNRLDDRTDLDSSLVVWQDQNVLLFVPKAQTSQWELQLMALYDSNKKPVGNIMEADGEMRRSLDKGIFMAQKALAAIGARMVTSIEYPKRIGERGEPGQHLLYAFLPRLPESPGAFSEAQLRFINGHYPEDFAAVIRANLPL